MRDLPFGGIQFRLKRARIDFEEYVSLFDLGSLGEVDLGQVSTDTRPDLDFFNRRDASSVLVEIGDLPFNWSGNGDRRWWYGGDCSLLLLLTAT